MEFGDSRIIDPATASSLSSDEAEQQHRLELQYPHSMSDDGTVLRKRRSSSHSKKKKQTPENSSADKSTADEDDEMKLENGGGCVNAVFHKSEDAVDLGVVAPKTTENGIGIFDVPLQDAAIDSDASASLHPQRHKAEPTLVLFFEVLFPFIIAGVGMVFAGIVFDKVQHWAFFAEVPQALILVPALLGLKGNLEMTLASRLSTQSNTGKMDTAEQIHGVVVTNIALIITQAIVVTFLAAAAAMTLAWIPQGQISLSHAALLCAAAVSTATVASLLLSCIMILVVLASKRYAINPDNVATPIAASLGDLTTLSVLAVMGNAYLSVHKSAPWLNVVVVLVFLVLIPVFASLAARDSGALEVLKNGWSPIVFSMLISSSGGFVLERAIRSFKQMPLYQPVMNGVGGNLAAVAASKLSTYYHRSAPQLGVLPADWTLARFLSPRRAFFSADEDSRAARVFLALCMPGHIFFNWLITLLHATQSGTVSEYSVTGPLFTALYLTAALAQVMILLFVCQWLIALMWTYRMDPDNAAIPYLTALGDLLGTSFLFFAFATLSMMKPEDLKSPGGGTTISPINIPH